MRDKKLFVGVTGGIGSGKSLVCKYLEVLGCTVIYADELAKKLYRTNTQLKKKLVSEFGDIITDGKGNISLDRLKEITFQNSNFQVRVNRIVHPFVIREKNKIFKQIKKGIVITEAALIFESGSEKYLDFVILVYSPMKLRTERIRSARNMKLSDIKKIISLQMPERMKIKKADYIITNNSTKEVLRKKTFALFNFLKIFLD